MHFGPFETLKCVRIGLVSSGFLSVELVLGAPNELWRFKSSAGREKENYASCPNPDEQMSRKSMLESQKVIFRLIIEIQSIKRPRQCEK